MPIDGEDEPDREVADAGDDRWDIRDIFQLGGHVYRPPGQLKLVQTAVSKMQAARGAGGIGSGAAKDGQSIALKGMPESGGRKESGGREESGGAAGGGGDAGAES